MLDRALRSTFRNFSTLFLLCAALSVPVAAIYCFIFRNAIAVHELHDTILTFPGERQVAGVGRETLLMSRWVGWGLVFLSILLLPLMARAVRRVLERDSSGHAPTVVDAVRERAAAPPHLSDALNGSVLLGLAIAIGVGVLTLIPALLFAEILSEGRLWVGVALARGVAWAIGAPFVLVPWALSSRPPTKA